MSTPYQGLHPSFIGSATVLNDGTSPNTLKVAFTNGNMFDGSPGEVNIVIKKENSLAFFFITDDSDGSGGKDADNLTWALATRSQILDVTPSFNPAKNNKVKNEGITWTVAKHPKEGEKIKTNNPTTSTLQGWLFTPSADFTLEPGDSLILELYNIITKLPDGPSMAYMYIRYDEMINGVNHPDHFIRVGPILKGPNIVSGNKVGIGTNDPQFPLSIGTEDNHIKIAFWDGGKVADGGSPDNAYGFGLAPATLTYYVQNGGRHSFRGHDKTNAYECLAINASTSSVGHVGITGKLQVGLPFPVIDNKKSQATTAFTPPLSLTIGDEKPG